ncbi:ewing's tumor-associated antigen 1 homolog isoform X2 [Corythoichthys intestinalis]|uniref:ewing's tumor-associated antigen 1 homolog isoform X2 n=1 Tax=Corythoichthys intestinalis TaxID=161448 RepID=UPI0025A5FD30|nr:ewing's tumor-associated antigen 1 homolog isoform X2 [Corythoichthys intestinalis]
MSEPRTLSTVTASSSSFPCGPTTDVSRSASKVGRGKSQDADVSSRTVCKELQSPPSRGYRRPFEVNHGYSPGDVEPSQDIVWDSTSPTQTGRELKNVKHVEIADIVNRIAPKETKSPQSPMWQWIGDSPISLTPERPKVRVRKKSVRQKGMDDLIKLARQFDKYMQQDKEALAQPGENDNCKINKTSEETSSPNQTEAELRALFDSSTQKVSGGLSPVSSKSSQDPSQHSRSTSGAKDVKEGFDDDWENDDMLNDPSLLALIQNPDRGSLQELCPNVKPPLRSTFKLAPNPHSRSSDSEMPKVTISDWDDREDDALFYQACDIVEKVSQPPKSTTTPLPIRQMSPNVCKSPRNFTRSNSLPGKTVKGHQEWNPLMSKSLPAGESSQVAFKSSGRNTTDNKSKVFVTSQMTAKCSEAEIERKKQAALARRRQRMQYAQKPMKNTRTPSCC